MGRRWGANLNPEKRSLQLRCARKVWLERRVGTDADLKLENGAQRVQVPSGQSLASGPAASLARALG